MVLEVEYKKHIMPPRVIISGALVLLEEFVKIQVSFKYEDVRLFSPQALTGSQCQNINCNIVCYCRYVYIGTTW